MFYTLCPDGQPETPYRSLDAAILVSKTIGPFTVWYGEILVCLWTPLAGLIYTDEWKRRMELNQRQFERVAG